MNALEKAQQMATPATAEMIPLDVLEPWTRGAIERVASCRLILERRSEYAYGAVHARHEVITVRADGTLLASDGWVLHKERCDPAEVQRLLDGQEARTFWPHLDCLVASPHPPLDDAPIWDGYPVQYVLGGEACQIIEDFDAAPLDVVLLHGQPGRDGTTACVTIAHLSGIGSEPTVDVTETCGWHEEPKLPDREWIVLARADWLALLSEHHHVPQIRVRVEARKARVHLTDAAMLTLHSVAMDSAQMGMWMALEQARAWLKLVAETKQ